MKIVKEMLYQKKLGAKQRILIKSTDHAPFSVVAFVYHTVYLKSLWHIKKATDGQLRKLLTGKEKTIFRDCQIERPNKTLSDSFLYASEKLC